jgi:hypothetical protein
VVSEELEQLLSAQFLWNPWCCLSLAASTWRTWSELNYHLLFVVLCAIA